MFKNEKEINVQDSVCSSRKRTNKRRIETTTITSPTFGSFFFFFLVETFIARIVQRVKMIVCCFLFVIYAFRKGPCRAAIAAAKGPNCQPGGHHKSQSPLLFLLLFFSLKTKKNPPRSWRRHTVFFLLLFPERDAAERGILPFLSTLLFQREELCFNRFFGSVFFLFSRSDKTPALEHSSAFSQSPPFSLDSPFQCNTQHTHTQQKKG